MPPPPPAPRRGEVWWVATNYGEKPMVVVSNDIRNASAISSVLAVRITNSPNPPSIPEVVAMRDPDPIDGRALCHMVSPIAKSLFQKRVGPLTATTMNQIEVAVRSAMKL